MEQTKENTGRLPTPALPRQATITTKVCATADCERHLGGMCPEGMGLPWECAGYLEGCKRLSLRMIAQSGPKELLLANAENNYEVARMALVNASLAEQEARAVLETMQAFCAEKTA